MAVDMFIKLGKIEGEAQGDGHKGEIDVLAWSWGMSNSGSAHVGGGIGAGKVNVQDLSFTKYIDKASPELMLACCNGSHIPEAKLVVQKSGGDASLPYLTISLNKVMVTSVSTGGSGGEDRLTENVTLNFSKVTVEYTEQTEKGTAGAKPKMTWDISANKKG